MRYNSDIVFLHCHLVARQLATKYVLNKSHAWVQLGRICDWVYKSPHIKIVELQFVIIM